MDWASQKINLMYVLYSMDNGGAETLAIRLADKLDKKIFATSICSLSDQGPLGKVAQERNIPFYSLGKKEGKDLGVSIRLKKIFQEKRITIVHTHNQGPLLYTFLATIFGYKPKIVHTEHINMMYETSYSARHILYNKLIYRCLDGFLSISQHLTSEFKSKYNLSSISVETVPNCVELSELPKIKQEYLRAELSIGSDVFLIGNISALRPQKDHATLIKAMSLVLRKFPNTHLVIAGDGELNFELRQLVNSLNIVDKVVFLGYRSDVKELLLQFDLFVLPSLYEGLPLCILEAMEAQLPIVATDVDGTNELIQHGKNGLLTQARNEFEMANTICSIISDKESAIEMGKEARKIVQEKYNFDHMIKKYENYYKSILV